MTQQQSKQASELPANWPERRLPDDGYGDEDIYNMGWNDCRLACHAAAQPEQASEPVAWMKSTPESAEWQAYDFSATQFGDYDIPLYAAQPLQTEPVAEPITPLAKALLQEFINMCTIGDMDETSPLGWGDLITETKAYLARAPWKLAAPPPQAEPVSQPSSERYFAIREGFVNAAENAYFEARPLEDDEMGRRIFHGAFCRGFDSRGDAMFNILAASPPAPEAKQSEPSDRTPPDPTWVAQKFYADNPTAALTDFKRRMAGPWKSEAKQPERALSDAEILKIAGDNAPAWMRHHEELEPEDFIRFARAVLAAIAKKESAPLPVECSDLAAELLGQLVMGPAGAHLTANLQTALRDAKPQAAQGRELRDDHFIHLLLQNSSSNTRMDYYIAGDRKTISLTAFELIKYSRAVIAASREK